MLLFVRHAFSSELTACTILFLVSWRKYFLLMAMCPCAFMWDVVEHGKFKTHTKSVSLSVLRTFWLHHAGQNSNNFNFDGDSASLCTMTTQHMQCSWRTLKIHAFLIFHCTLSGFEYYNFLNVLSLNLWPRMSEMPPITYVVSNL